MRTGEPTQGEQSRRLDRVIQRPRLPLTTQLQVPPPHITNLRGPPPPIPTTILPPVPTAIPPQPRSTSPPVIPITPPRFQISTLLERIIQTQLLELEELERTENILIQSIQDSVSMEQRQIEEVKLGFIYSLKNLVQAKLHEIRLFNTVNTAVVLIDKASNN